MARQMIILDDEIEIEVVRKEEITEVPVHFKVDKHTNASMTYLQYVRFFNWRDVEGGNCTYGN
jgi:hypothetical protein